MSNVGYVLTQHDGVEGLTVVIDGVPETVSPTHANYSKIKDYLENGGENVEELRDLISIPNHLMRLSDRVGYIKGELTFDGDVIDNALSKHIVRLLEANEDFKPFVSFMDNLALNPSRLSRVHLFKWLEAENFTITEDGMIVGYKSVQRDRLSHHSGVETVFVNGEGGTGKVPNPDGAVVEMARSEVDNDREVDCSNGLHVGTWGYASTFYGGATVLKVLVNPRDVVSVPKDHGDTKMRTCRYVVVGEVNEPNGQPVEHTEPVGVFDEDEYDDFDLAFDSYEPEDEMEDWEYEGFKSAEDYQDYIDGVGAYGPDSEEEEDEEPLPKAEDSEPESVVEEEHEEEETEEQKESFWSKWFK